MPAADPGAFCRRATRLYRVSLATCATLSATCLVLAWLAGARWGLLAGIIIAIAGLILAAGSAVAATIVWAMSQDGA